MNTSLRDHYRSRRDACGIFNAVRNHQHRQLLALAHFLNQREHLLAQGRVERRKGFVEQQQRLLAHQTACQRHALALAAGKLPRKSVDKRRQAHLFGDRLQRLTLRSTEL